jgi:Taurine catabolism dioxygenase TauD, TfdA family
VGKIADEMCLKFEFKTGDIQFLNNLAILHAREEFKRAGGDEKRRHLLRLVQMDDELGWNVPLSMQKAMAKMFDHGPKEEKFIWSPEPLPYVIGQ